MLIHRVIVGTMFTNAYIVSIGKKECAVIDPGADTEQIVRRMDAMNLIPQLILFTHGHIDHTSSARDIIGYYSDRTEEIRVGIHEEDALFLGESGVERNRDIFSHFGPRGLDAFDSFTHAIPDPDFFFSDGETIPDTDLVVMHTGGHSAGSSCFYSESRQAVFSGDVLFFNTIGRGDFPSGNPEGVRDAVSRQLFSLPGETRVFPGHGPLTSIEREMKNNPLESTGATF